MQNKILILGDGLLGSELHKQTGWDVASRKLNNLPDLEDWEEICCLVNKYDVVVNCIACTDTYSKDSKKHWDINFKFVRDLSEACNTEGVKLVHISTEFVYAKNPYPPTEEDLPMPDNTWYAYTKLLADEYIKVLDSDYLICRELHKPTPFPHNKVWRTQTTGDTVDKIASLIIKLIKKGANGVFNVGTGEKCLCELAPNAEVIDPPDLVPKDTRMDLTKLNKFLNE